MQKHEMVEKKKVLWDGIEIEGLVSVAEVSLEKMTVDVPSFRRIRQVQSDMVKLPPLNIGYALKRDSDALKFCNNFFDNNEVHDLTVIRTDAHGVEFDRVLYPDCEIIKKTIPAYEAGNPTYAKCDITVIPWDIIQL